MKKYTVLLLLLFSFLSYGATIDFRSGKIYSAEFGIAKIDILNWNKHLFDFENINTYAAVAVKLAPRRNVSIYDYALMINGRNYPCIAIKCGSGKYQYTQKGVAAGKDEFTVLLFALNDFSSTAASVNAAIVCQLPPDKGSVNLKLTNRYEGELCAAALIFKNGNF